jgi:coenzyme F420-reducing hydrogenase alpha subunit
MSERRIHIADIARVEGEGRLDVELSDGEVVNVCFEVKEPPRFFEVILVGRHYSEVPDFTSRICGICPVSYQTASIAAIEDAFGFQPSEQTRDLRNLLALSQWIQSHSLHIYMLALPDYLGVESALALASDPGSLPIVKRGLSLKRLGNDITKLIGGREIHPVSARAGGFTDVVSRAALDDIARRLEAALADARETVKLAASIVHGDKVADFSPAFDHIALSNPTEYAVSGKDFASTGGLSAPLRDFRSHIVEHHAPPSNALRSRLAATGRSFMVGPLARVNLNFGRLSPGAKEAAKEVGARFPNRNPYYGMMARALEVYHAIEESLAIIGRYRGVREMAEIAPKVSEGWGASEAPRGLLYHNYEFDENGIVQRANIVTPTAMNSANIEENLTALLPRWLSLSVEEITLRCETLIRAYDPCFSCSAHFLKLNIRQV